MFVDTHVHFDILLDKLELLDLSELRKENESISFLDKYLDAVDAVSRLNFVNKINNLTQNHSLLIHSTVSTGNFYVCYELFKNINNLHFLLGSHPEIVKEGFNLEKYLENQEQLLQTRKELKFIGIGEVGLDYYYTSDENLIEIQKKLLISQIKLANKLSIPLVFHVRNAFDDFFTIIKDNKPVKPFIVHCFTSDLKNAVGVVNLGGYLGIGGICTYPSAVELNEALKGIDYKKIVLETDLPFLSPMPHRGKVCLPNYIEETAKYLSSIYNVNVEEIFEQSLQNAKSIFEIK